MFGICRIVALAHPSRRKACIHIYRHRTELPRTRGCEQCATPSLSNSTGTLPSSNRSCLSQHDSTSPNMVLFLILSVWNAITVVCVIVGYYVSWVIYSRTLHPLAKVPGPVWPAVSRTWLIYRMYQGDLETHMRAIHNRFVLCCCEHWSSAD